MTAPPPMPKSPARIPLTTPAPRMPATSSMTSPSGTPKSVVVSMPPIRSGGCGARRLLAHERERGEERFGVGARLDACGGKVAAERARFRHRVKQADRVARDGVEPHAARDRALDIGNERQRGLRGRRERSGLAEQLRV